MIAASVPDSEPVLKLLLQKGADVNEKSEHLPALITENKPQRLTVNADNSGNVSQV